MGQAKLRGTFEERKAKAIKRKNYEAEEHAKADMEFKANNLKRNIGRIGHRRKRISHLAMATALAMLPPNK